MRALLQVRGSAGAAFISGIHAPAPLVARLVRTSAAESSNGVGPPHSLVGANGGTIQYHGSDDRNGGPVGTEGHSQVQATAVDCRAQLPFDSPATTATTSQYASSSHNGLLTPSTSGSSLTGSGLSVAEAASVGTADDGGEGPESVGVPSGAGAQGLAAVSDDAAAGAGAGAAAGAAAGAGAQGLERGKGPSRGSPSLVAVTFVVAQHPVALGESLAVVRRGAGGRGPGAVAVVCGVG